VRRICGRHAAISSTACFITVRPPTPGNLAVASRGPRSWHRPLLAHSMRTLELNPSVNVSSAFVGASPARPQSRRRCAGCTGVAPGVPGHQGGATDTIATSRRLATPSHDSERAESHHIDAVTGFGAPGEPNPSTGCRSTFPRTSPCSVHAEGGARSAGAASPRPACAVRPAAHVVGLGSNLAQFCDGTGRPSPRPGRRLHGRQTPTCRVLCSPPWRRFALGEFGEIPKQITEFLRHARLFQ